MQSIAAGNTKLSSISSQLEIGSGGLTPYISKLIELDILQREIPVTEDIKNSKKALYKIKDNYLMEKVKTTFDLWVSKVYEDLWKNGEREEYYILFSKNYFK